MFLSNTISGVEQDSLTAQEEADEYLRVRDFIIVTLQVIAEMIQIFWRYCQNMANTDSLACKWDLFEKVANEVNYRQGLFYLPVGRRCYFAKVYYQTL